MAESSITIAIPDKVMAFINKKVSEGYFSSIEDFVKHAIYLLSELYGLPGTSTIEKLLNKLQLSTSIQATEGGLSKEEIYVLSLFGNNTFLYKEEIYARALGDAMRRRQKPYSKEKIMEIVDSLVQKGILEKIEKGPNIIIKKLER